MTDEERIDRIERIRANNNRHWMDVVRLALKIAPDDTRRLLDQIAEGDDEVRQLTKEIARA